MQRGKKFPGGDNLTFEHEALATSSSSSSRRITSCNTSPRQGNWLLQSSLIATSEALVPFMFWYTTLLTCTAEACTHSSSLYIHHANYSLSNIKHRFMIKFIYLFLARFFLVAIMLIDNYWIGHVAHFNILKQYIFSKARSSLHIDQKDKFFFQKKNIWFDSLT